MTTVLWVIIILLFASQFGGIAQGQQYGSSAQYAGTGGAGQYGYGGGLTIQGLEGLQGFSSGENRLSLAIQPVNQQGGQLFFQVVGFAISSPASGQSAAYALKTPLMGVLDQSQNTLQIDLSSIGTAISSAGYVSSANVYDVLRSDPSIMVIDIDMNYANTDNLLTIFDVNAITMITPDGNARVFQMQQPTQLVIDAMSYRIYMVTFP